MASLGVSSVWHGLNGCGMASTDVAWPQLVCNGCGWVWCWLCWCGMGSMGVTWHKCVWHGLSRPQCVCLLPHLCLCNGLGMS